MLRHLPFEFGATGRLPSVAPAGGLLPIHAAAMRRRCAAAAIAQARWRVRV